MSEGTSLISLHATGSSIGDGGGARRTRSVTALALELVPRITRAQSMDVLSSQSTVAGYKAVLIGAAALGKFLPMLTTAAGNISPARCSSSARASSGLQAIATARRLGGVVSAFDVRPAAREQVQSLGATFVANELVSAAAETAGGYARAQTDEEQQRTLAAIAGHIKDVDLVITTAQIPGTPAPTLITAEMVQTMRAGSVIVDLAAETGGNCELSKPGETVHVARCHDHRAAESAEHRAVSRQPDVRPQHPRAAQASREGRRARARPGGRDHRRDDDDSRGQGAQVRILSPTRRCSFSNCTSSCWPRSSATW